MNNSEERIIAIGDLHGKDCWKKINPADYSHIIFMGDYVDSLTIPPNKVLENLRELIRFKRKYYSKVTLLLGNHDMQYIEYPEYGCGGFNSLMQPFFTKVFRKNSL